MAPKCGETSHNSIKRLEDSSMTYEESDDLYFQTSKLEELFKGIKVDLDHLKGGSMRTLNFANLRGEFETWMR